MRGLSNGVVLAFSAIALLFYAAGCGSTAKTAAETLANLSNALTTPVAGGSSRERWIVDADGIPHRSDASRAACETIRTTKMVKSTVQFPKQMLCMFGAMETNGIIARPSGNSSYNYYQFAFTQQGRPPGQTFKFRYGNDASGNLVASACQGSRADNDMEFHHDKANKKITVTNVHTPPGATVTATGQIGITYTETETDFQFSSATMQMGGSSASAHSAYVSLEKVGTLVKVKERFSGSYQGGGTTTRKLYSEFTETQGSDGSSKVSHSGVGSGVEWVDSWTNNSTYLCEHPKTAGDQYATVNAFDLATITAPTTPDFLDRWTGCEPPAGTSFTTINMQTMGQTLGQSMQTCFTEHGSPPSFLSCETAGGNKCDSF